MPILARCVLACIAMLTTSETPPAVTEFSVPSNGAVDIEVNGHPAHMLFRGVGSRVPIFNPGSLARLGVKPGLLGAKIEYRVGPVRVNGNSGVAQYAIGGRELKRRVGWFERDVAPGFDGLVGPAAIDYPVVTLRLRMPTTGERVITYNSSELGYLGTGVVLRGRPLTFFQFDPWSANSHVNAAFANELAAALNGNFAGEVRPQAIAFGIERPVRRMEFARPLVLGALKFTGISVRIADWGDASQIPENKPDPNEIVVTAPGKQDRNVRFIIVGADALSHCSSISFDKVHRQIRLSCSQG